MQKLILFLMLIVSNLGSAEGQEKPNISFGSSHVLSGFWYSSCYTRGGEFNIEFESTTNEGSYLIRYKIKGSDVFNNNGHYSPESEATINFLLAENSENNNYLQMELEHEAWRYNLLRSRKTSTFDGTFEANTPFNWQLLVQDDDVVLKMNMNKGNIFGRFEYDGIFNIDDVGCFIASDEEVDPKSFLERCEEETRQIIKNYNICHN
ncbi:hypothetical protein [Glaciecola sp. 1036]|uniref:hypothetical protein n=1 Tax=Alteromonadaceae TaxID=72275 RepID=UPI003D08EAA1